MTRTSPAEAKDVSEIRATWGRVQALKGGIGANACCNEGANGAATHRASERRRWWVDGWMNIRWMILSLSGRL